MKKILMFAFSLLLIVTSCEKEEETIPDEALVTVSSEFFGTQVYYVNGYSFELGKHIATPAVNSVDGIPDIVPENILLPSGDLAGILFTGGPGNNFGFYKNFESNTLDDATDFYNNYTSVDAPSFTSLSDTLKAGQVYTFRTRDENYVKLIINEVRLQANMISDYYEVDIRYFIQRDGSVDLSNQE